MANDESTAVLNDPPVLARLRALFPGQEAVSGVKAAKVLGISTGTLYAYIDDGAITAVQPGGARSRYMVRLTELARVLGEQS